MKRNILYITLSAFFFLFCVNINAQEIKVIDNKGTLKSINKVTYGTLAPTIPLTPGVKDEKGDIYIIGSASSPQRTYIFDGVNDGTNGATGPKWVNITSGDMVMGQFFIDYSSHNTTKEINDLPFNPSKISFVAHANIEVTDINTDNGTYSNDPTFTNSFGTMNGYAIKKNGAISQQVIYIGGSARSINDISRYASPINCIGLRFSGQNGESLGTITASLTDFKVAVPNKGFTLSVNYTNEGTPLTEFEKEKVLVMYFAYR